MMVPIPAGVTQATNVGQATSDDVTVSFRCFLFNLVTFQKNQRYRSCAVNAAKTNHSYGSSVGADSRIGRHMRVGFVGFSTLL